MDFRFGAHEQVAANRKRALSVLGLSPGECVQQQGLDDGITAVGKSDRGKGMGDLESRVRTNALITSEAGVGLFLCVADCLPIILFDPMRRVIALIHAARNSTNLRITAQVVRRLEAEFGCAPRDLIVGFGPAIQARSYTFDDGIYKLVDKRWGPYLKRLPSGRIAVDNVGYNRAQLEEAGVPPASIDDCSIDTAVGKAYFSHVRSRLSSSAEQRFAAVVALT
jgi:copper oxidase (laccase) domain-containing protein